MDECSLYSETSFFSSWMNSLGPKPKALYYYLNSSIAVIPKTSSISSIWKLIGNANSQVPPEIYWIRSSGDRAQQSCFLKHSRWFCCIIKFENHCSVNYRNLHCELLFKYYSPTVSIKGILTVSILFFFFPSMGNLDDINHTLL